MARFEPFAGIRYDLERSDLGPVIAPPYDVIDAAQRAALAARDPHNAVRIDLPDEADGEARYERRPRPARRPGSPTAPSWSTSGRPSPSTA